MKDTVEQAELMKPAEPQSRPSRPPQMFRKPANPHCLDKRDQLRRQRKQRRRIKDRQLHKTLIE